MSNVYAVGAHQQGGYVRDLALNSDLPAIWSGTSASWTPLATGSQIAGDVFGIWDGVQVGGLYGHAVIWFGTPQSIIDLHPAGTESSGAGGVRGNMQVGSVVPAGVGDYRAALWRGTAASFVNLHPANAVRSVAVATDGVLQGGFATWPLQQAHAVIWNGTAQSNVDLSGGRESQVYGMAPGVQVGYVHLPAGLHAAVWHGTAASFVDLNGPMIASRLFATTGSVHVGQGGTASVARAIVNFGTPDAWVELHQFLPPGYSSFSAANAVYQDGPTIYVGGYAVADSTGADHAMLWIGSVACYANCDQSTVAPILNVSDFGCFINRFAAEDGYANCDQSTTPPTLNVQDFLCFINRFAAGCAR